MLKQDRIQVHMHLYYKDPSIYLMDKIRQKWDGRVNISLNEGGEANDTIVEYAKKIFPEVRTAKTPNLGNDQIGFKKSVITNKEPDKDWILYVHDKSQDKQKWVDDIVDPIINQEEVVDELIEKDEYGIISSAKRCNKIFDEEYLIEFSKKCKLSEKNLVVGSRHTLVWLRELQYILYDIHGFIDRKNINFQFTAGTMFLINEDIVKLSHDCIHENYFEKQYRPDGKVEHALERFYYYVSACLRKKIMFI